MMYKTRVCPMIGWTSSEGVYVVMGFEFKAMKNGTTLAMIHIQ